MALIFYSWSDHVWSIDDRNDGDSEIKYDQTLYTCPQYSISHLIYSVFQGSRKVAAHF
jgi:hypothetical protein